MTETKNHSLEFINLAKYVRTASPLDKALLLFFALVADSEGRSWYSEDAISFRTEMCVRSVKKSKHYLKNELRVLTWENRAQTSSLYQLLLERLRELADAGKADERRVRRAAETKKAADASIRRGSK